MLNSREFDTIVNKLKMEARDGDHRFVLLRHEGKVVVRTKRSHGNKSQPGHLIRQQLKLNEDQFAGLIRCSISRDAYIEILKEKGLLGP